MATVPRRDILASLLIAFLLAVQLPFVALSNRAGACLSLIAIGGVVLLLGGALHQDLGGWLALSLVVVSTVTGTLAIPLPSALLSTISIGSILVLWSVTLTTHLTFRAPELDPATRR